MTVSFCVAEEFIDLTEWFIRCSDGEVRDKFRRVFIDDNAVRVEVKAKVAAHTKTCKVCSKSESGAELEVASIVETEFDTEFNDYISEAVIEALGFPFRTGSKIYGYADGVDMKARLILAFAFIEEKGKQFSDKLSNKALLENLEVLYRLSDYAAHLERDVVWIEYPEMA